MDKIKNFEVKMQKKVEKEMRKMEKKEEREKQKRTRLSERRDERLKRKCAGKAMGNFMMKREKLDLPQFKNKVQ